MVWARHRRGKSSKMHLTSWNTLEKQAKSVLTFLPKRKPLCANCTIKEHKSVRKSKKDLDDLPPTQDALILHIKRANYQTMVWNKALEPCPSLPKPEDSGWYYSEGLMKPKLMTREVSAACLQFAYCGCSREGGCCVNLRCTCVQLSLCCSKAC
ncbi:unnamed protein product [Porites evermanni]|uniref:Uncharacterized protein n=1 Tax=Porites evermanni TaxID=104178 RepID=A0ABN8PQ35_9CNID|nr:unnamed protein product [Porites evermanni]